MNVSPLITSANVLVALDTGISLPPGSIVIDASAAAWVSRKLEIPLRLCVNVSDWSAPVFVPWIAILYGVEASPSFNAKKRHTILNNSKHPANHCRRQDLMRSSRPT